MVLELLEDILTEILFKLSVKSLLKFKTVSKSWYSIIKSEHFVKKHLNHSHSTLYDQHKDFLALRITSWEGSNRCILYNQNSDGIMYAKEFSFPFKVAEVCNYCDGLICFKLSIRDILVWNPSLPAEYKIIPMEYYKTKNDQFWVGMGYDSTADDYKIVGVPEGRTYWNTNSGTSFVKVFSMKSKSWTKKEISKNFIYRIYKDSSIYTQNRLHWCGRYYDCRDMAIQCIVYFDMVEEKLDVLNFPCKFEVKIFNCKDSLAIIHGTTLWVLKEYNGIKSSWTKFELLELNYCEDIMDSTYAFCYRCFTRDGKVLIELVEPGLVSYDPKDGYVRNVEIQGDDTMYQTMFNRGRFHASAYVESLVSLRWFE